MERMKERPNKHKTTHAIVGNIIHDGNPFQKRVESNKTTSSWWGNPAKPPTKSDIWGLSRWHDNEFPTIWGSNTATHILRCSSMSTRSITKKPLVSQKVQLRRHPITQNTGDMYCCWGNLLPIQSLRGASLAIFTKAGALSRRSRSGR